MRKQPKGWVFLPDRNRLEGFRHLHFYCAVPVEEAESGQ